MLGAEAVPHSYPLIPEAQGLWHCSPVKGPGTGWAELGGDSRAELACGTFGTGCASLSFDTTSGIRPRAAQLELTCLAG